jgi:hypothetical protein
MPVAHGSISSRPCARDINGKCRCCQVTLTLTLKKRLDIVVVELLANHPVPVLPNIRWALPDNFVAVCNMHNGKFRRRLPRSMHDETAFPAKAESFFSYGIRIDSHI